MSSVDGSSEASASSTTGCQKWAGWIGMFVMPVPGPQIARPG